MTDAAEIQPGEDRFQIRKPMPRAQAEPLAREILDLKRKLNAGHPRPQLSSTRNPGRGRFRRRFARTFPRGCEDERRRDCF